MRTNHDFSAVLFKVLNLLFDTIHFRQKLGLLSISNSFALREIGKLLQYRSFLSLSFLRDGESIRTQRTAQVGYIHVLHLAIPIFRLAFLH